MIGRMDPAIDVVEPGEPGVFVDEWLGILVRLLDLPSDQRESIRRELDAHLRERVRDLIIDGRAEDQAVREAINELGDAAELARKLRRANRYPRRRLAMNLTMCAVGAGIVGVGVVAFQPEDHEMPSGRRYVPLGQVTEDAALDRRVDIRFDETPLGEVIDTLGEELDRTVFAHWRPLADLGIDRMDTDVTFEARNLPMRRVLELVRESIDDQWSSVRWMVGEDLVELGPVEHFDRREVSLVSYDIAAILDGLGDEYALSYEDGVMQVTSLVQELVSPEHWQAMGGDLAQLHVVGGRMFVEAPPRMHHELEWILGELGSAPEARAAGAERVIEQLSRLRSQNAELEQRIEQLSADLEVAGKVNDLMQQELVRLKGAEPAGGAG